MNINFSSQSSTSLLRANFNNSDNSKQNALNKNQKQEKSSAANKNNQGSSLKIKKNSALDNLMEQRSRLVDSKQSIMENSLKNGEDPKSIKEKLAEVDKQIREIDKQVSEMKIEEQQKALGNEDKDKKDKKIKNKSDEKSSDDAQTNQSSEELDGILDMSSSLSQSKAVSSQKRIRSGEIRVLDAEIKMDKSRGVDTTKKEELSDKMKEGLKNLDEKIGKTLSDVTNKIKSNKEDTSINNISKNGQIKNISDSENAGKSNKLLVKLQQNLQNIKKYSENQNDKAEQNVEKIDAIA